MISYNSFKRALKCYNLLLKSQGMSTSKIWDNTYMTQALTKVIASFNLKWDSKVRVGLNSHKILTLYMPTQCLTRSKGLETTKCFMDIRIEMKTRSFRLVLWILNVATVMFWMMKQFLITLNSVTGVIHPDSWYIPIGFNSMMILGIDNKV